MSVALSLFAQLGGDAGTAVGFPALAMNLGDLVFEDFIFQGTRAGREQAFLPVVIAAGRNLQKGAELLDGERVFHRVNALAAVMDGSERMPNVFFKNVALLAQMAVLAAGVIELGLEIGG